MHSPGVRDSGDAVVEKCGVLSPHHSPFVLQPLSQVSDATVDPDLTALGLRHPSDWIASVLPSHPGL
jgi:hypothetical protein